MELETILERLQVYKTAILKRKLLITFSVILFGILLAIFAYTTPKLYTAKAVFHPQLNQNQGGGIPSNPLSLILNGGTDGVESGVMIGILESRNISESLATDTVVVKEKEVLIADAVINSMPKRFNFTRWIKHFIFGPPAILTLEQKSIRAGEIIRQSLLLETTTAGFIEMKFTSFDQKLATLVSEKLLKRLDKYYRDQKTQKARQNLIFFTLRADSVKMRLDKANQSAAAYYDRTKFGVSATQSIYPREIATQQELLTEMYVTLEINKEQAKAQLQETTPVIQVLDKPIPPHKITKRSLVLYFAIGIILGLMIPIFFFCRKLLIEDIFELVKSQINAANTSTEE